MVQSNMWFIMECNTSFDTSILYQNKTVKFCLGILFQIPVYVEKNSCAQASIFWTKFSQTMWETKETFCKELLATTNVSKALHRQTSVVVLGFKKYS